MRGLSEDEGHVTEALTFDLCAARYLFGFEEYCRSASITFRTIHHNDPPPPALANHKKARAELKEPSVPPLTEEEEPVNDKREESDSESEREIRERPSLRVRMPSRRRRRGLHHRCGANASDSDLRGGGGEQGTAGNRPPGWSSPPERLRAARSTRGRRGGAATGERMTRRGAQRTRTRRRRMKTRRLRKKPGEKTGETRPLIS